MKNAKRFYVLLFAGMACIVMFGLLLLYVNYISGRAVPTFPRITINTTIPEGVGVVNQPVIVFGIASDPDGIESAELWVNGVKVATQSNTNQNLYPFEISQSWIPDGPGNYIFLLRGIDRKGFAGDSTPVMIQIEERTFQPDPTLHGQYIVQAGDTIDDLAARFGTTPDEIRRLNPELGDLTPGESLSVPPSPETDSGGDVPSPSSDGGSAPLPGDGSDEPAHVSPPSAPSSEAGMPAIPVSAPWWGVLPLPGGFSCILTPAICAAPSAGEMPPLPASDVHASLVDACQVSVDWTDNSTNEASFRVYRLVTRPRFRFELVELLDPSPNSGERLNYVDTSAPTGEYYYTVVTINSRGEEVWGPASEKITTTCSSSTASGGGAWDVEALEMTVNDSSIEQLYCYLSLAGSPFERIPQSTREFITLEGGAWNIADYASGDNKRTLMLDGTSSLEITAECLGRQGGTLIDLGRFTRSHPPAEWDGRPLIAGPDDGAFRVAYRIQPTTSDGTSGGYGGGGEDPTLPVPFNLRATESWADCRYRSVGTGSICSDVNEPGLSWDYHIDPAYPPLYFKVDKVTAIGSSARSYSFTTLDGTHMSAPLDSDCGLRTYYHVKAVVGIDPASGAEIESSYSEALGINPTCAMLEITLNTLTISPVNDNDLFTADYEAYGHLRFNGIPVRWNNHCDLELCGGGSSSSYTVIDEGHRYRWVDLLAEGTRTRVGMEKNLVHVTIRDGEPLNWALNFMDHDDGSSDDLICRGRSLTLLPAHTLEAWLSVDEFISTTVGPCTFTFFVRSIPETLLRR